MASISVGDPLSVSAPLARPVRRPRQQMLAVWVGLAIVLVYLLLALFGEAVAPYSYTEQNFVATLQPPSLDHLFGTDQFGRDIFSRVVVGSRSIMGLAGIATLLSLLIGGVVGVVAGYAGRLWDEALMRVADVLLSFPAMLLALLIISTLGSEVIYLILTIVVVFAPGIARVVRSETLGLAAREFIDAAHATGVPAHRIVLRHLIPNLADLLVVEGSIYFSYAILIGSGLSFLGLGVQPPSPDWGLQVNDGRNFVLTAWWITVFPSLAISSLVLGVNLLADGLTQQQRNR
ncbi:MAG: ABC transporter permease [Chloroflexi bacterium]|nr:ABC transporter permease [Chloroflexota bacterium]